MFQIRTLLNPSSNQSDTSTLLGPWLGEFGPELIYWQGFVREYARHHPEEYLIVAGHPGRRVLYETASEYWEISSDTPSEPNFFLHGGPRSEYYQLIHSLESLGLEPDKILIPERVHELGWLTFGDPGFNQRFIPLEPSGPLRNLILRTLNGSKAVILFPRFRGADPDKNWSPANWERLARKISAKGLLPLQGGGPNEPPIAGFAELRFPGVQPVDWLEFQIGLVCASNAVVSGESGPGFLPGLCRKPGILFGSERERLRYTQIENIFHSPIQYITSRNPSVDEVVERLNEYI